jgi:hypothetical protein
MRFRVLILVGALLACGALSAQEEPGPDAEERLINDQSAALVSPPTLSGPASGGNVNYFDRFIAALQSFSESGGEALTLDYNFPEDFFGKSLSSKLQLAAKKPALNAKYLTALGTNTARITLLQNELGVGDDLTFSFSISPQEQKKRDTVRQALSAYQDEAVKSRIAAKVLEGGRAAASVSLLSTEAVDRASRRIANSPSRTGSDFEFLDAILRGDESLQDPNVARSAAARAEEIAIVDETVRDNANVAAQQSKFNFNASYRNRRESAGPDEWFVKTSYEYGFGADVPKRVDEVAKRNGRSGCREAYLDPKRFERLVEPARRAECVEDVVTALREAANSVPVQTGTRLTFALEYHNYSTVDIALDNFKLPGSKSLVASLNYGRDVFANKGDKDRSGRIELIAAYDDVSGDKNRKNRLIGTLTYSQRINDDFYIPVSLVYANQPDYLSNVDRKFNAHFGIAYKLQKPKS